jgi:murein DD-endopeptidase MepM/ murein hydrolase activator NlpD
VIISLPESGSFVTLVHLQRGSICVSVAQDVTEGQQIASCGNSGNSTQPHVHMQATDSEDLSVARGVPMVFRRFRERLSGAKQFPDRERGMPGEGVAQLGIAILQRRLLRQVQRFDRGRRSAMIILKLDRQLTAADFDLGTPESTNAGSA